MRIVGGDLRGKQINPPANFKARPTTDFAKEGLFNILSNQYDFEEISVLDLFSGTGSISFEFASRGCKDITAVEMNPLHASFIKSQSAKLLGREFSLQVVHHNVFDFLKICTKKYDLIFADPPYDLAGFNNVPDKILGSDILLDGGLFIFEHPKDYEFKNSPHFLKERNYGNVHFSFFSKEVQKNG